MVDRQLLRLNHATVDEHVGLACAGTFALGFVVDGEFVPFLVGRSDSDLNSRLHSWVGVDGRETRYGQLARAPYGSRRRRFSPLGTPALASVGMRVHASYTHFEFGYATSADAAFLTECERYHELGGCSLLDNEGHPAPPRGAACRCPAHSYPRGDRGSN